MERIYSEYEVQQMIKNAVKQDRAKRKEKLIDNITMLVTSMLLGMTPIVLFLMWLVFGY